MPLIISSSIQKKLKHSNNKSFVSNQLTNNYLQSIQNTHHNTMNSINNNNKYILKKRIHSNHDEKYRQLNQTILKPKYQLITKEIQQNSTNPKLSFCQYSINNNNNNNNNNNVEFQMQKNANFISNNNYKINSHPSYQWDSNLFGSGHMFTPEKLDYLLRANSFLQNMANINHLVDVHNDSSKANYDPESGKLINLAGNMLGFLNSGNYRPSDSTQVSQDICYHQLLLLDSTSSVTIISSVTMHIYLPYNYKYECTA
ncbi:unnamed protein product [Schistosoma margrebowiei]|uniref:Uncharacterized protein n=1 Tax=Schistosoma margrebowiei TaxID=48269 RepID=A0A183MB27_9TREM|nr:unnamed protein product [Schistosoma margrebowiei]